MVSPFLALKGFGAAEAAGGWPSQDQSPRALADVNGDGRADIVGFGFSGAYTALGQADGTFAAPIVASSTSARAGGRRLGQPGPGARVLGDVNGDGRADIVGFGFAGDLYRSRPGRRDVRGTRRGINTFGSGAAAGGWVSQDQAPRVLGDVNGDGRADIVGFGYGGTYTALGQADGTFAAPIVALNTFGSSAAAGGWAQPGASPATCSAT